VLGTGAHGIREAVFLRGYTADVTLIALGGKHDLAPAERALLAQCGVATVDGPTTAFAIDGDKIGLRTPERDWRFDSLYPALGSDINSGVAIALGAARSTKAACSSMRINGPMSRGSMPRETWSRVSTRSATRWAKAAWRPPRFATTWRASMRCCVLYWSDERYGPCRL